MYVHMYVVHTYIAWGRLAKIVEPLVMRLTVQVRGHFRDMLRGLLSGITISVVEQKYRSFLHRYVPSLRRKSEGIADLECD